VLYAIACSNEDIIDSSVLDPIPNPEGRKWLNKKMGKGEALYYTYYEELDVFLWRAGGFYTVLEHGRPSWVPRRNVFLFC
jgi:hypothetical protein